MADGAGQTVVVARYVQFVIDGLLVLVVAVLGGVAGAVLGVLLVRAGAPAELFFTGVFVVFVVAAVLASLWLDVWYPHRHGGATLGMRWLGLRVVTLRGGPPSLQAHLVRWLLLVVDGLLLGLVGAVLIAVTPRNQRLGDMVTETLVVRAPVTAEPLPSR